VVRDRADGALCAADVLRPAGGGAPPDIVLTAPVALREPVQMPLFSSLGEKPAIKSRDCPDSTSLARMVSWGTTGRKPVVTSYIRVCYSVLNNKARK
jgi:hypothetical protein